VRPAVVRDVDLAADERLDAVLLRFSVQLDRAREAAVVGERDGRHLELCRTRGERRDAARPVEDRVLGVDVEVDERRLGQGESSVALAQDRTTGRIRSRRVRRSGVDIRVEVDPDEVLPGQSVEATIRVVLADDLVVEEGRVDLVYENEYAYRTRRNSYLSWAREETVTDQVVEASARFLARSALAADTPYDETVSLTVPETAAPSAEGTITSVRWWTIARLARQRGRDLRGFAELHVLSEPRLDLPPGVVATHGDCELYFELERDDFAPADVVEGTLIATPLRNCVAKEVRVELVRREEVPRDEGNAVDVVEDEASIAETVSLTAGVPQEWPFQLRLPEIVAPSLRTDQSRVTWLLKGIASRRLRADYTIVLPIDVHTAPS